MRHLLYLISTVLFTSLSKAQVNTVQQQLIWLGANVELDISPNFTTGLHTEERRFVFPDARQQRVLADLYLRYKLNHKWQITTGIWLFEIAVPQNPLVKLQGQVKEIRPYLALSRIWLLPKASVKLGLQSEYRIFKELNDPSFFEGPVQRRTLRQRFLLKYSRPLSAKTKISFYDELHLTLAASDERPLFQQNRLGTAFQYAWTKSFSTTLGYLFWFQPTGLPDEYFARQIVSFKMKYRFRLKSSYTECDF